MFLNRVPGFRTDVTWKKILSSTIHIFMLILIIKSFSSGVHVIDMIVEGTRMIFLLLFPYILITNLGSIRNKLPLLRKENRTLIKILVGTMTYSLVFIIAFLTYYNGTENLLSSEQKVVMVVREQESEIEAKLKKEAKKFEEAINEARIAADNEGQHLMDEETKTYAELEKEIYESETDNFLDAEKSEYIYVDYSELVRSPKVFKGKKIVSNGKVITIDIINKNLISVVEVWTGMLAIVVVPQSSLDTNILENDYISFYGEFKGVTSTVSKLDLASNFFGDRYYRRAMPYFNAKYVDILQ